MQRKDAFVIISGTTSVVMLTNGQIEQNRHKQEGKTLARLSVCVDAVLQHDADGCVNQHLLDFYTPQLKLIIKTVSASLTR